MSEKPERGPRPEDQADPRIRLSTPMIVMRIPADGGGRRLFGYAKNLSRSGMYIGSVNPREPGESYQVELKIPPPVAREVKCGCEVVWKRQYQSDARHEPGMGLRFFDLPDDVAEAIDDWAHSLAPNPTC